VLDRGTPVFLPLPAQPLWLKARFWPEPTAKIQAVMEMLAFAKPFKVRKYGPKDTL